MDSATSSLIQPHKNDITVTSNTSKKLEAPKRKPHEIGGGVQGKLNFQENYEPQRFWLTTHLSLLLHHVLLKAPLNFCSLIAAQLQHVLKGTRTWVKPNELRNAEPSLRYRGVAFHAAAEWISSAPHDVLLKDTKRTQAPFILWNPSWNPVSLWHQIEIIQ